MRTEIALRVIQEWLVFSSEKSINNHIAISSQLPEVLIHTKRPSVIITLVVLLSAMVFCNPVLSQVSVPDARPGYGAFGNFNFNSDRADFQMLPGFPSCCPQFASGSGTGFSGGLLYELPLASAFSLMLRASYVTNNALLTATERAVVIINEIPTNATIEHSIDSRISSIGFEPLLAYAVYKEFRLHAGGRMGFVMQKKFDQKEALIEPANTGTFNNGLRTRNVFIDNTIPEAQSLNAALLGGVSYRLPLNKSGSLFLHPEVLYSYGLTDVVKSLKWNLDGLRVGASIVYSPLPVAPPPPSLPPPLPPPPAPKDLPALVASVTAAGVTADGKEEPIVRIRVEEFVSTEIRPLLNYVFFDENSSALPDRYIRMEKAQTVEFKIDDLYKSSPLEVYHRVLNIIGKRLKENPDAKITITGCNSNSGIEANNSGLSKARAEAVRNYFASAWDIPAIRMDIKTRNLPISPSKSTETQGAEENRRVEISSASWVIMEPVTSNSIERTITPSKLRFKPVVTAEADIRSWELSTGQDGKVLKSWTGTAMPENVIEWDLKNDLSTMPLTNSPFAYSLDVKDKASQQKTSLQASINLEKITVAYKKKQRIADKEISKYNLILFDYDSPKLNAGNKRIADLIRENLAGSSSVLITGYTDLLGEEQHNLKLSEERAINTANTLKAPNVITKGLGETGAGFPNDLPEGRFYNRTVEVRIEKKVQ